MLRNLHIRDYAIIEALDVDFNAGLNIVTGETGAGKSIIVGALKLLLGGRASGDMVRAGARKAVVEASFDVSGLPAIGSLIREAELDELPELIIRREVLAGSSRAFVNDSPALLTTLRAIGEALVDLHGQHDQQSLLKPSVHREVIDAFGSHETETAKVAGAFRDWRAAVETVRRLESSSAELMQIAELHEFQRREIDEVAPVEGEEEGLDHQRRRLANAGRLRDTAQQVYDTLYADGEAIYDRLSAAAEGLEGLVRLDEELKPLVEELRSALISVDEVASSLRDYGEGIEDDPEQLATIQTRLGAFEKLKRRYGGSIDAVLAYRQTIGQAPTRERLDAELAAAKALVDETLSKLRATAIRLSERRRATADGLAPQVKQALSRLGMDKSDFEVRVSQTSSDRGVIAPPKRGDFQDGALLEVTESGIDDVEFYISPNPGEPLRQLARSASGGEISRIMLALKAIVAERVSVPVLVFDEIDVGISGAIAQRVGEEMHAIGRHHQVIAITHLPQIAAQGDAHFVVEKTEAGGRTRTVLRALTPDERAAQVARLMSGARVTDSALANARELIAASATVSSD